jgi:hypothetical protein
MFGFEYLHEFKTGCEFTVQKGFNQAPRLMSFMKDCLFNYALSDLLIVIVVKLLIFWEDN